MGRPHRLRQNQLPAPHQLPEPHQLRPSRLLLALGSIAMVLVAGMLGAGVGAGPAHAQITLLTTTTRAATTTTTSATTTSTTSTTVATTTSSANTTTTSAPAGGGGGSPNSPSTSVGAALLPCDPASNSSACTSEPRQLEVTYPSSKPPAQVEFSWVADQSRPAGAPEPGQTSVVLSVGQAATCDGAAAPSQGTSQACWAWPAAIEDHNAVLNGSYQVTPCVSYDGSSATCPAPAGAQPAFVSLAAPPAPPRNVNATVSGQTVTVKWMPSSNPEPDLAGYAVTRNGQLAFSCNLFHSGQGGDQPCPNPLQAKDQPGGGWWIYQVSAVRLGSGSGSSSVVASDSSQGKATPVFVTGKPKPHPASPGGGSLDLPPVPIVGAFQSLFTSTGSPAGTAAAPASAGAPFAGEAGVPPDVSPVQNLNYPGSGDDPVVGAKSRDLALKISGSAPDVVPAGLAALALLILAIAAHLVYLRVQIGIIQARNIDHS